MATLQTSINLASPFPVANGGTGATTLTTHGIVYGNGVSAVGVTAALNNGQLLIGSSGAAPVPASLTSTGGSITVSAGAGTLNIDLAAPVSVANGGTGATTLTAHGILVGEGTSAINPIVLTNGQLLIGSTGADPVAASLTAGANITITPGAGSITIASTASGGISWAKYTANQTMAANGGYIADSNVTQITFTLPAAAAVGDTYQVMADDNSGTNGWLVAQNAGQTIRVGNLVTTAGVAGKVYTGTGAGDWIEIVCTVANTNFVATVRQGSVNIV